MPAVETETSPMEYEPFLVQNEDSEFFESDEDQRSCVFMDEAYEISEEENLPHEETTDSSDSDVEQLVNWIFIIYFLVIDELHSLCFFFSFRRMFSGKLKFCFSFHDESGGEE